MEGVELDNLLWHLVHKFMRKQRNFSSQLNNTAEDLMSEAKLAALMAIRKYDAKKAAKIKTWIYVCVENHLRDLSDYERSKPSIDYVDELPDVAEDYQDRVDFNITMKRLLRPEEYRLYEKMYVEGFSMREVVRLKMFKEREAQCLHHRISSRLASLEESLDSHLTQKKLQENWLADFAP